MVGRVRAHPLYGLALAGIGTLVLTPDSLFMRLSQMDGFQMTAWRGLLMGAVMIGLWAILSRDRGGEFRQLFTRAGALIVICQFFNSLLFCLGIAMAPVAVVLFGLATVPVWAALLARLMLGEATRLATWITIAAVMTGIGIAVLGGEGEGVELNLAALAGAGLGLGVAFVLALNFVVIRSAPQLPIMLVIGAGALLAGGFGLAVTGGERMGDGHVWAMATTGIVVLPVSFFLLSLASRYTHASNVSLLMLLETVLGPLWVWLGVGEAPTMMMILGGFIVVGSLAIYILWTGRRRRGAVAN
ncbi:DMT family transporter [Roseovarius sp. MMSF_3281]|uniref:DMT family transporter n=1 Tax=Roseovarius sp. MMSF_3281 TaxID=3046694 RepID=UPI00273DE5A8|nr:DMT family transporter [Roseovarius sp. MMSF_3281]